MSKFLIALLFSVMGNIIAWIQMNGQFKYEWMRQWWVIGLMGIPVSYFFFYSTRWYYEYFNNYWYVRPIGFSVATITFGALAWLILDELPDTKTIISLFLSIIIVILQLSK
jgi:hypothetical protein